MWAKSWGIVGTGHGVGQALGVRGPRWARGPGFQDQEQGASSEQGLVATSREETW